MNDHDESKRLRVREASLSDDVKRTALSQVEGAPCLVARTMSLGSYPTAAGSFFACNPVNILGVEVEGGAGIVTSDTASFFAYNLGSAVPPPGSTILTTFVGSRWVFRYDG